MESTVQIECLEQSGPKSDGVGSKRPIENGGEGELLKKKARFGSTEMKRVAEIVLVLSAMAEMRGGRSPTEAEAEMMAEAREKVALMCEALAPKDVVERESIGAVIEDLGLNLKAKEQKLGFRPPKMSIAEKFLLTKRRMEESKEFTAHSGTYSSQRLQTSLGSTPESRGMPHVVRALPSDKSSNVPNSSGGFPTASPLGHISTATSTISPYQLPANEVRPSITSSGLHSSSGPKAERANFRLDGGVRPVQDSYAGHALVNAPTWSVQSQSATAVKSGSDNKVPNHASVSAEGTALRMASQSARSQNSRPIITQTSSGNLPSLQQPLQGMNIVQNPAFSNNHSEIGMVVHKFLQPRVPQNPTWTPPSRDYMNKALTCQICQLTINEVDSVLLCDACEKGSHLICLQSYNQNGIPKGEWHCPKCLSLSNGKALPPKYGRVMRNMNTSKGPPKMAGVQSSSEKKAGTSDQKTNQQKITANGSSSFQTPHTGTGGNSIESGSALKMLNTKEIQENNLSSSRKGMDDKPTSESCQNNSIKSEPDCGSPSVSSASGQAIQQVNNPESSSCQETQVSVSKSMSSANSGDMVTSRYDHVEASHNPKDVDQTGLLNCAEVPLKKHHDKNVTVKSSDMREDINSVSGCDIKQADKDIAQAGPGEISGATAETRGHVGFATGALPSVGWIGDPLKVVDGKTFYQSCCINGVSYKVQDHALLRSSNDKLIPSKLQAMWEDTKSGSKWVVVNWCYFPGDLPEVVGHPCTPESNEVYESNHDSTVMAGLIQGSCEVLPPKKYKEESERRHLGSHTSDGSQPVFLCRWLYDEFKGLFEPVSR